MILTTPELLERIYTAKIEGLISVDKAMELTLLLYENDGSEEIIARVLSELEPKPEITLEKLTPLGQTPLLAEKPEKEGGSSLKVKIVQLTAGILAITYFYFVGFTPDAEKPSFTTQPWRTTPVKEPRKDTGTALEAFIMSQSFVEERLKAPSTARFPRFDESSMARQTSESVWFIRSYVDSQNSFGAMMRATYVAEIEYLGKDKWKILDLQILE